MLGAVAFGFTVAAVLSSIFINNKWPATVFIVLAVVFAALELAT